ncbi:hypothetical protein AB0B66_08250 [Catellatospora sp. NPDC049111]|uniref:hypothetical protein n=1 Tax=Catellatospora sp. NPDC049111 TaxID=3155271 RepID=UPI0033DF05A0
MESSSPEWGRARVLSYASPLPADTRFSVLWPAWAYRVTAPVLKQRGLDVFERVVLALCETGMRQPGEIGKMIKLDARLCAHIMEQSMASGRLNARSEVTETGREALRTGVSALTPEWQVCYVFEDPFTGDVWPRVVENLNEAYVVGVAGEGVELELATAGRSDRARARRVRPPHRAPVRPSPARVVEAASASRAAHEHFRMAEFERRAGLRAMSIAPQEVAQPRASEFPDSPELLRVAFLNDPVPVYLLGFIEVRGNDSAIETAEAWTAHDPFGLGPSEFFQSLVFRFGRADGSLDAQVQARTKAEIAQASNRYQTADRELRALLELNLVQEFGQQIRDDEDAFDLMIELEMAVAGTARDEAVERIAHTALRLYEVLFKRLLRMYPLSPALFDSYMGNLQLRRALLEKAAQSIGFHQVTTFYTGVKDQELRKTQESSERAFVKAMCVLSLLAATEYPDHPLRAMAQQQPDLPVVIATLNQLRNRGAHASRDATNPHDTDWCRQAAACATTALTRLPQPRHERTTF